MRSGRPLVSWITVLAIMLDSLPWNAIILASGTTSRSVETWNEAPHHGVPAFDNATAREVTAQRGQTAYLHCIVHNLRDKTVSWIRRRDFTVLTVGLDSYTTDDRFQPIHMEVASDWTLQIKYVQQKDVGLYECQVSSDPKISYFVNLTVLVASARIGDGPDRYVKTGSAINLTCVIAQSPEPPAFVFWYHEDRMINYDSKRGEIAAHKAGRDMSVSRLFIKEVQSHDSGNYTCCPSNAEPTSIMVHVINGEKPAAMQHDGTSSGQEGQSPQLVILVTAMLLILFR